MIECNVEINFGQPALRGRRLTVYDIVTKIYYEDSIRMALSDYEISLTDAKDAVNYCMHLKCKQDKDLLHFCDGCLLRTLAEGWNFKKDDYLEVKINDKTIVVSKDSEIYFFGTLQEYENSEFGKVTWLIAEEIHEKFL